MMTQTSLGLKLNVLEKSWKKGGFETLLGTFHFGLVFIHNQMACLKCISGTRKYGLATTYSMQTLQTNLLLMPCELLAAPFTQC